jgi:hypothetical protein
MKSTFYFPVIFVLVLMVSFSMMSQQMSNIEWQVLQQEANEEMQLQGTSLDVPYEPKAMQATGDDCNDPLVITVMDGMGTWSTYGETTCGRVDDYNSSYGTCIYPTNYANGEDLVYELVVLDDMWLEFNFDPMESPSSIWIMKQCPDIVTGNICLAGKSQYFSTLTTFKYPFSPGSYYIQIDSYSDPGCITFDLWIDQWFLPPPPDPITCFPYKEDFESGDWPNTMQPFAGEQAHAVLNSSAAYISNYGAMLDGNSSTWFFHSTDCDEAFANNYPYHSAKIKMNYTPDGTAGTLQLKFDFSLYYTYADYYSGFRVTVDGSVLTEETTGLDCLRGNQWGPIVWTQLLYDLSAYQTPGQNYELVLDFYGKYYYQYAYIGDVAMIDNINLIFYDPTANPVAICQDITVPANANCEAAVTPEEIDNGSYDPNNTEITLSLLPEGPYQLGETLVTLTVTNENGATDECTALITVVDDGPPAIHTTTASMNFEIWPPNHKYETFIVEDFVTSVEDNCAVVSIDDVFIVRATSDEPEDAEGNGDGSTLDDIVIASDCRSVQLRKEREGTGNGRVYTVFFELVDETGNIGNATSKVQVPHNMGETAIDDGVAYEEQCGSKLLPVAFTDEEIQPTLNNYPNPFNNNTTITFTLAESGNTILKVYNTFGNEVATLFDGMADPRQEYSLEFSSGNLPAGIYLIHLQSGDELRIVKKMVLRK